MSNPDQDIVTRVTHDGRIMLNSVKWWLTEGKGNPSQLFCIHNIALDSYCQQCSERND